MSIVDAIEKVVGRLEDKIERLFRRGEVTRAAKDHTLQASGLYGEQYDRVEYWQHHGLSARPPVGSEVLLVHLNGRGRDAIAIATNSDDSRPADLDEGEVVLHGLAASGAQGQVRMRPDGTISAIAADGKFVEVGGSTDAQVLGTTLQQAFAPLVPATDPASAVTLVNAILGILRGGAATPPPPAAWLSTKAKVG